MGLRQISGKDADYQFVQTIGSGGFGTVTKVRRVRDGRIMACKSIDCSLHPELEKLASREVEIWASFGTEKYIAAFSNDCSWNKASQTIRIYMDFYEGGDLQKVIETCHYEDTTIHPVVATYWAVEIARGIKACHDHRIIHRDIKPQNILLSMPYLSNDVLWSASNSQPLNSEDQKLAKEFLAWMDDRTAWCHLTDFGLGKFSTGAILSRVTNASYGMVGTPGYMAPESLGDSPVFSSKSDVYSMGCLLYNLCTCKRLPSLGLLGSAATSVSIPDYYPKRMQDLIGKCLQTDSSTRPTSREVLDELTEIHLSVLGCSLWTDAKATLEGSHNKATHKDEAKTFSPEAVKVATEALRDAILFRDLAAAKKAIAEGADVNAFRFGPYSNNLLEYAAAQSAVDIVRELLDRGVRFEYKWKSCGNAVDEALNAGGLVRNKHADGANEVVKLLFERGLLEVNTPNDQGTYLIHTATKCSNLAMVQWLVQNGASLRVKDENSMRGYPIHYAANNAHKDRPQSIQILKYFLELDPECIDLRDDLDMTPLHEAGASVGDEAIAVLFDAGADVFAKDYYGTTPRERARIYSHDHEEQFRRLEQLAGNRRS